MAEIRLELVPFNRDKAVYVSLPLILLPAEIDLVSEERHSKKNSSRHCSSSGSKVVLTLVTKVIAVYVELSAIYVYGMGFQLISEQLEDNKSYSKSGSGSYSASKNGSCGKSASGSYGKSRTGSLSLQNSLKNPLQVILGILGDITSIKDSN